MRISSALVALSLHGCTFALLVFHGFGHRVTRAKVERAFRVGEHDRIDLRHLLGYRARCRENLISRSRLIDESDLRSLLAENLLAGQYELLRARHADEIG